MKYLFVLSFIAVFIFLAPDQCGYSTTHNELWRHFLYIFSHANLILLILNSICFLSLWIPLQRVKKKQAQIIVPAFIIAVAVSFIPFCISHTCTVGSSGICYAFLGMLLSEMRIPFKSLLSFRDFPPIIAFIMISLALSFFLKNSNFYLHLFCLIAGFLFQKKLEVKKL